MRKKPGFEIPFSDEPPKYKKKSHKQHEKKSNHPHVWTNCVFEYDMPDYSEWKTTGQKTRRELSIGTYCSICGKIGTTMDLSWTEVGKLPHFRYFHNPVWTLNAELQFDPKTRTLPHFYIGKLWKSSKYVPAKGTLEGGETP